MGLIDVGIINGGTDCLVKHIEECKKNKIELFIFDVLTEKDLQKIADLQYIYQNVLWVGSAGIAQYLCSKIKPVFLVAGSVSNVTRKQIEHFSTDQNVRCVELDPMTYIEGKGMQEEKERCKKAISDAFSKNHDVAFYSQLPKNQEEIGKKYKVDLFQVSVWITKTLGEIAAKVIRNHVLQGLILTGGDTARSVCQQLNVSGIQIIKEVESGIPMGQLMGEISVSVITKAGAFGDQDSLLKGLKMLKGEVI